LKTIEIALWALAFTPSNSGLGIVVTHKDGTPIADVHADIGIEDEISFRLTTEQIESDYNEHGDPDNIVPESHYLTEGGWDIRLNLDEDGHLSVFTSFTGEGVASVPDDIEPQTPFPIQINIS
jgi:sorbitol-specific phosphotransferase system component IIA